MKHYDNIKQLKKLTTHIDSHSPHSPRHKKRPDFSGRPGPTFRDDLLFKNRKKGSLSSSKLIFALTIGFFVLYYRLEQGAA